MIEQFRATLTSSDYTALDQRWIDRETADRALLQRVDSPNGAEHVGRKGPGRYEGILVPYVFPGENWTREFRLRRDHPEVDGRGKPIGKYLSPPGKANMLYFPIGTDPGWLTDSNLPIVLTEGEFKTIALFRLAHHELGDAAEVPSFMSVGLGGVWNWRGVIGKRVDATGTRVNQKGPIPDLDRITWEKRRVVILFDRNVESNALVKEARSELTKELKRRKAKVAWFVWPHDTPEGVNGVDDLLAKVGPGPVLRIIDNAKGHRTSSATVLSLYEDWPDRLILGNSGPKAILANAITALREANDWKGVLRQNLFSLQTVAVQATPWGYRGPWSDHEDARCTEWLHHRGILVPVSTAACATETVATENGFHPVRDYLSALRWDGTLRLDTWLTKYAGVEDTEYTRAVGAKYLISAVARIFKPGVKVDHVLTLEGEQGILKSTLLEVLGDPWYTDHLDNLDTKDASMQTAGVWIIEISELDALGKAEASRIKAFLTRKSDRFRPPFGRRLIEVPRQCVFAGTVNISGYLKDETGGRRFWPVRCSRIDIDALGRDGDQLFAEAAHRYQAGESWWLESRTLCSAAADQQQQRYDSDPWTEKILQFIESRESVTSAEILEECLRKEVGHWTQADKNRIARVFRANGWERHQEAAGKVGDKRFREWRYRRKRSAS